MKLLATYIMRGRLQAIMVACLLSLLSLIFPPVSIVSSATVALVTLRRGAKEGGYILLCASLVVAVLGSFLVGDYRITLFYSLLLWMPIWLISIILREGRHLFLAIEIIMAMAIIGILFAYSYQPNLGDSWQTELSDFLEPMVTNTNPDVNQETIKASLSIFFHFMLTGLIAQLYVCIVLAGLFLGRSWQALLYNSGGFKREYLALRGQKILGFIALMIVMIAWLSSGAVAEIFWNISLLFLVLYTFLGMVVLHGNFLGMKLKRLLIPFLYISLILVPHAMIPVAIIGLTDTWLNLRKTQ